MHHTTKVKQYYEQNTRRFLFFKRDSTKSIHQPLWKEPTFTKEEAYAYANQLILEAIQQSTARTPLTIIDLGCGVGSSIFYLQKQVPTATYYGITISEAQIAIAQKQAKQLLLQDTVQFLTADFTNLPTEIPPINIAFSIEAFAHAADAEKYIEQISQKLKKGGKLILIDDFLNDTINLKQLDEKAKKALQDFQYGWLVNSLKTKKELTAMATKYGLRLIHETDLTPYMRNGTLKHKWIRFLVATFRWVYHLSPWQSYYFRSWIGGQAKQYCLKNQLIRYKKMVFEKVR